MSFRSHSLPRLGARLGSAPSPGNARHRHHAGGAAHGAFDPSSSSFSSSGLRRRPSWTGGVSSLEQLLQEQGHRLGATSWPSSPSSPQRRDDDRAFKAPLPLTLADERLLSPSHRFRNTKQKSDGLSAPSSPSSRPGSPGSATATRIRAREMINGLHPQLAGDVSLLVVGRSPAGTRSGQQPLENNPLPVNDVLMGIDNDSNLIRCEAPKEDSVDTQDMKRTSMRERFGRKRSDQMSICTSDASRRGKKKGFYVLEKGESLHTFYELCEEVHNGGARGKVIFGRRRRDNSEVAIKIRPKRLGPLTAELSWRAIMVHMQTIRHQHVLEFQDILEDEDAFYVVMPKCNGGELFDFLVTETEIPERECKRIIREILGAVKQLHDNQLIHRDIKPENIMLDQEELEENVLSPPSVKLIDFDTCMEFSPTSPKSTKIVGTPGYIAPEALLGEVTPQSDLWSIGVIFYILMTGATPWSSIASLEDGTIGSKGATRLYQTIKEESLGWDEEPWLSFPEAKDLCSKLLSFWAEERPKSVEEAMEHPWLREEGAA